MPVKKTSALNVAKIKRKAWTMSDANKTKLENITKQNIESSWWNLSAWLRKTREQLGGITKPTVIWAPVASPGVSTPSTPTWPGWWTVSPDKKTFTTPGWVIAPIAPPAPLAPVPKPEDTITDGTSGTWAAWLKWDTWAPDTAPWGVKWFDINKDGIINESELTWDYKTFYDTLSDTEKKLFIAKWENAMKDNLDVAEVYANYMRDYETTKTRKEQDEFTRLSLEWAREEAAQIQESQIIRRAKASVNNLKQNIAYLGNLWAPWVSWQRMVSLDNQMTEAETSLRELDRLQVLSKASRETWAMANARQYERQMEDITTTLNDDVDKAIQSAYNELTQATSDGKLSTVSELTAFRDKMYNDLDASITWFTDASIEQMKFLIWEVNQSRKEAVAYEENTNTINKDMSAAIWYYVDGNWNAVYDAQWARIKIPKAIPEGFEPFVSNGKFFSPKMDAQWELVLDENGSPIFNSTQLEDKVSVTAQLANAYVDMVNKWVMTAEQAIKAIPELANNEAFIKWVEVAPWEVEDPNVEKIIVNWKEVSAMWNEKTKKWEAITDVWQTTSNISKADAVIWDYELDDWTIITASKWTVDALNNVIAQNPEISFDLSNLYRTREDQYRLYGKGRTAEELQSEWIPWAYAKPDEAQVTWTTKSSHMTWNAVDVVVPEWQDKVEYTKSIEDEMNKQWFFRPAETLAQWDYGHFEYKGLAKTDDKWIMWALWVPIAYERQIKQMVPTQLMNSEIELEALNDTITRMWDAWMTVEDAVLTYLWFDITVEGKEEAINYVNVGRNMWEDLPTNYFATVSNHLAKWDMIEADKYVSNIVEDKVKKRYWEDAIMSATMNQTTKDTAALSNLIAQNPEEIGAFDWRVNDFMRKFKDYPEMTKLNTLLTMTQAQTRKHFAWSAVTPSEMEALQDFIGWNTKMTPNNLLTMLGTIKDRTESQFLLQRKQFGYTPLKKDAQWNVIKDKWVVKTEDPLDLWIEPQQNETETETDPLGLWL